MILVGTQALEVCNPPPIPRGLTLGNTLGSYPGVCAWQTMYSPEGGVSFTLVLQPAMNRASIPVTVRGPSLEHNSNK